MQGYKIRKAIFWLNDEFFKAGEFEVYLSGEYNAPGRRIRKKINVPNS